ncbi:MAG: tetratricopeptide repeat protein [Bacteroidota bacterium]
MKETVGNSEESQSSGDNFDVEETLDIDQEKNVEGEPVGKQNLTMRTIVIVVLLLLPVIYIIYKTMGNSDKAQESTAASNPQADLASYENTAKANPTFANLLNLSNAYINQGMAGKSIEPLEKAIALNPQSAIAYSNLGFAYTVMQQFKKGIEYGEKAVQLDSTFQLAKNNLNWAKDEQKKLLKAIQDMEKTSEDKRTTEFYVLFGLGYLKLEEYNKSIEVWNKILVYEPQNVAALNNIGVANMSLRKYDDAISSFKKATEAAPNDQLSKNNLAWATDEKVKADKEKTQNNK